MAWKSDAGLAREAARMVDEIVAREKCSRTAVFRRLGITDLRPQKIMSGEGCTAPMLERIRTEHERVCGAPAKAAGGAGKREEPAADESEESKGDEDESDDASELEDDEFEEDTDEDEDEEPAPKAKRAPARFGPTVPGKGAPLLEEPARAWDATRAIIGAAMQRTELHRAADVIAALGGIDNAERVVAVLRSVKEVA